MNNRIAVADGMDQLATRDNTREVYNDGLEDGIDEYLYRQLERDKVKGMNGDYQQQQPNQQDFDQYGRPLQRRSPVNNVQPLPFGGPQQASQQGFSQQGLPQGQSQSNPPFPSPVAAGPPQMGPGYGSQGPQQFGQWPPQGQQQQQRQPIPPYPPWDPNKYPQQNQPYPQNQPYFDPRGPPIPQQWPQYPQNQPYFDPRGQPGQPGYQIPSPPSGLTMPPIAPTRPQDGYSGYVPQQSAQPKKGKKTVLTALVILCVLMFLAFAGSLAMYYFKFGFGFG
jgi:hypothetical protein